MHLYILKEKLCTEINKTLHSETERLTSSGQRNLYFMRKNYKYVCELLEGENGEKLESKTAIVEHHPASKLY